MAKKSKRKVNDEKLIELARLLLPDEDAYPKEVALAVKDPARYVTKFHDRLEGRGISEPQPDLPWLALVDGLWARGKLAEIDWRGSPKEIVDELDPLVEPALPNGDRWDWMDDGDWEEAEAEMFLKEVDRRLTDQGYVLAWFDIQSDSYPVAVLKDPDFQQAKRLASESGFGRILRL